MFMGIQVITDNLIKNLNEGMIKSWLEAALPSVFAFFWCIVLALITYFIGRKVIKFIRKCFRKTMNHNRNMEEGVKQFLDSIINIILHIFLLVLILNLFGITTSSIAAAVAALGVTAGLSLQGALSNFAGGVLILTLHPFRVGDYIIEDSHGNEGIVETISIIYTTLRTKDGKKVVVPNGTLANASLTNCSDTKMRREDIIVGISYESDIKTAKDVLLQIAKEAEGRVESEEINVFVDSLGESSVNMGLRFWVDSELYWTTRWKTMEEIKLRFDSAGVSIPYNQLDVHLDK